MRWPNAGEAISFGIALSIVILIGLVLVNTMLIAEPSPRNELPPKFWDVVSPLLVLLGIWCALVLTVSLILPPPKNEES